VTQAQIIEISGPGGPEVLVPGWRSLSNPGPGEVLLAVEACGVNRPDVMQRQGRYRPPPGASDIPGLEAAGEVLAVGDGVPTTLIGQRMTALCPGGGYASHVTVPWQHALPWPEGYTAVQAAALPETFFTVYGNMVFRGRLKAGESVLIHGGSSGIGTTAIQMAKALGAAQVIVTVRTTEKAEACRALGADHALQYPGTAWEDEVLAVTDGTGADVILDMVAGPYVERNQRCLATDGRLVLIASQGGSDARFDATAAMVRRQVITGSTLRPQSIEAKNQLAEGLRQEIWPLLNNGSIAPVIAATFPLEQAAEAHRMMESGDLIGKIVLITQEP
jgi:NADPH2:quinone reductase